MGFTDNVKDLAKTAKETVMSALELVSDPTDIRNVIKQDHLLVAGMLDSLMEKAQDSDPQVFDLVESLRSELLLHAKSEERVLYESCKKFGKDLRTFAQEGFREHELMEHLLDRLVTEAPSKDGEFKATLSVLKEMIDHHVREEEGDLFPKLQQHFKDAQLVEMGKMMERVKNSLQIAPINQRKTA